jgi:hypothetical protein
MPSSILSHLALSINLDQMAMVVNTLPFAAHVRLLNANRYILANLQHAQQLGFDKVQDVLNISYSYIARHREQCITTLKGNLELEKVYQHFICQANIKTELAKKPRRFQVCTLFPSGFIYIGRIHKIPILDAYQRVNAILTFSQDITKDFDLLDIYPIYKRHYSDSKQAIQQFIKYFEIDEYFRLPPTQRELLTLLMFRKDVKARYVAQQLKLSDRTIEEYKSRLRNKMKAHVTLEQVLLKLLSTPSNLNG